MFKQIEIDFEVFKELTFKRKSAEMTENDVIRELLGLPMAATNGKADIPKAPWAWKGVILPHGTEMRMNYNGREYRAEISEAAIKFDGQTFISPTAAAVAVTNNQVNGWNYWDCKLPGSTKWEPIKKFRKN